MDNLEKPKRKTGPRPKKLVTATYTGIEVGRGETKKIVDPREVEKLASIGCKVTEIAEYLGVDDNTLKYNFRENLIKGRSQLKQSLRQAQIKYALAGSVPLLIWLGKQVLGQSDVIDEEEKQPEMTREEIDNRIQELLKTLKDEPRHETRTDDAAPVEGAESQVQQS